MGFRGPKVEIPKPPGVFRVVLLGGSTSHGFAVRDDETIDAHLRRSLERAAPGRRVEVVSLDAFAATIREMADVVPATTSILLSSPPSALAHDAPSVTAGVVDAATTRRYRDALDARMRAVAAELAAGGRRVTYVQHDVSPDSFLDDCHLTPDGNRKVAEDFAQVLARLVGR